MLTDLPLEEKFFAVLTSLDAQIAEEVAVSGCPHCGGPLYKANYERKPRGGQIAATGGLDHARITAHAAAATLAT